MSIIEYNIIDHSYIFLFINNHQYEMVEKKLIENPCIIDERDAIENTPLMHACQSSNVNIVKLLLKYGSNVNAKNRLGSTALHFACINSNIEIIDLLFNCGACYHIKTVSGKIPMDYAIFWNNYEVIEYLTKYKEKMKLISIINILILSNKKRGHMLIHIFLSLPWQIEQFVYGVISDNEIAKIVKYRDLSTTVSINLSTV